MGKNDCPQNPSTLALSSTHAKVCTNISCWGHFLSHGLYQNPGVFVARKSEAALACWSHHRSPCGYPLRPAVPINPMRVPTRLGCLTVGGTRLLISEEISASTSAPGTLLGFPAPSFQNINLHSFGPLPLPSASCLLRSPIPDRCDPPKRAQTLLDHRG